MGLLDEAIRDHLDLRRRHGADPADLARQERDALGPVRREAVGAAEGAGDAETPEDGSQAGAATDEPGAEHARSPEGNGDTGRLAGPRARTSASQPTTELRHVEDAEPPPDTAGERSTAAHDPAPSRPDALLPPPLRPTGEPPSAERARTADPAGKPPAADEAPSDAQEPDGDMLQETPEFLQETPEHDRLWFEQSPPRDFDFDK